VTETDDPATCDEAAQPCENVALAPAPQANSMPAESTLPPGQETPSRTTFVPRAARLPFSLRTNVAMSTLTKVSWLRSILAQGRIDRLAEHAVEDLRIRTPGIRQLVRSLSGGNQQKVVLSRALTTKPRIFLLDEPTRGIDVGAKVEVYRLINALAERGAAILVVSSDMLELLGLCDRVLVMRTGRIAGMVAKADFSQERIMSLAALG